METRDKRLYSIEDYQNLASDAKLYKLAKGYYNSAADDEHTLKTTQNAFDRVQLRQRTFVDESKWQGLETTLFGKTVPSPICIAPAAFQKLAHPDGELAVARACSAANRTPMFLSSFASTSLEDVSKEGPGIIKMY